MCVCVCVCVYPISTFEPADRFFRTLLCTVGHPNTLLFNFLQVVRNNMANAHAYEAEAALAPLTFF